MTMRLSKLKDFIIWARLAYGGQICDEKLNGVIREYFDVASNYSVGAVRRALLDCGLVVASAEPGMFDLPPMKKPEAPP